MWNIILDILWWIRNFLGNVVLVCAVAGIILALIAGRLSKRKIIASSQEKRIAIVTGASSGLGMAYAKEIAREESGIDEIWLIARRKGKLEALAQELKGLSMESRIFPMDLTCQDSYQDLVKALTEGQLRVGLLINCAGYAKIGNYERVTPYDSLHMIDLNCKAAVQMTTSVLPFMKAGDRIMQVCSTAAFQPLQHMNIYGASKAFLYHYTRALRMEVLPRRIMVTAVCPYWIKDTEFIQVAKDQEELVKGQSAVKHFPFSTKVSPVARRSLRASRRGKAVSTPGIFCWVHRISSKLISREVELYIWEGLRRL